MSAKQALGRGLKALIPDTPRARAGFAEIPIDQLRANPQQPRHRFDPDSLEELAASIRLHGVLQPLLVSEDPPHGYLLITGERRTDPVCRPTADAGTIAAKLPSRRQKPAG